MKRLEAELGFELFRRNPRGIVLTVNGRELLAIAEQSFARIETKIAQLSSVKDYSLTIGVTTYFASRWLSPRLMEFMREHPQIRLRIQPMVDLINFTDEDIDIAIRWGNGKWQDRQIEELFICPAWPTGNQASYEAVKREGVEKAFANFTLLRDREDSNVWSEWFLAAGLDETIRLDTLTILDPNVRVQAVSDGQGIALNDDLVKDEIENGKLYRLSPVALNSYGYFLAYNEANIQKPEVVHFINWIKSV